jgi:hypothetical protein
MRPVPPPSDRRSIVHSNRLTLAVLLLHLKLALGSLISNYLEALRSQKLFQPYHLLSLHPGFFPIAAEMRDPRYYTRALLICQSIVTATYISVGTVVYYYCGSFVASPALGSAGV